MFFDKIYRSWKAIQLKKYEKILQILPELKNKKILDIGIGPGYFEEFLKNKGISADIIGIDLSKEKSLGKKVIADGNVLPFADNCFDAVICLDTIHLIKNDDFARVLKPSGLALLSIFLNKQNL
ncbi:MAG: class I SAM-dependent methyltransferase, partial [Candidatus Aenigmarchaeota archaeon]|nr:class I SAM-dependent methyltransferase [Candidatus Aenigmarchaeota archaeon]